MRSDSPDCDDSTSCKQCRRWQQTAERNAQAFEHYKAQSARKDLLIAGLREEIDSLRQKSQPVKSPGKGASSTRSVNTLAKIVGGLALAVYGYNPHDKRSDAIRQMQNDLDHQGINLDADTLRKWIREGLALLKTAESVEA